MSSVESNMLKTSLDSGLLNKLVKAIVPALTFDLHKGQCGRIGVVGGSINYTGAPYFAAISALKAGADLAHVFCSPEAATVIKSYSPELIVHPVLSKDSSKYSDMKEALHRMHAYVLGPGLGRDDVAGMVFRVILADGIERGIPVVIDADGLHFVAQSPSLLQNARRLVITPNEMEFSRIYKAVFQADCSPAKETEKAIDQTKELCRRLGNITVVRKGAADIITDGTKVFICDETCSPRRCGGQGDLLSGSMGAFFHWSLMAADRLETDRETKPYHPSMIAAYAACLLTRQCNRRAYANFGRSTTTSDMISCIPVVINDQPFS